jgi:hypothetical protein
MDHKPMGEMDGDGGRNLSLQSVSLRMYQVEKDL